ncbi:serine--tRNA ligase [bacterium]|nr:serine--tRNA ligase [bacterium]
MLDRKFIRQESETLRQAIVDKRESADLDAFLEMDKQHLSLIAQVEELQAERNRASAAINEMKKSGEDASSAIAKTRELSQRTKELEQQQSELEEQLRELQLNFPNIPADDVPRGGEQDNLLIREWGEPVSKPEFEIKPHWDIGEELGLLDLARGAKVAGSGFPLLTGEGARFQRALINFMLDLHREAGFTELIPPLLVNSESATGTGQLPKLIDDMYHCSTDDLWLIPTSEVPVTNMFAGEILGPTDLPRYYTAYTPCFRREAGAHGKDTRGLLRVHQFDKVEMVKFVRPETSEEEHESLLAQAEKVLQALELPYRVMLLASGDLSFAAAKCYDLEIWSPGVGRWLEVSSVSNFGDFQARRAGIRFRPGEREKPQFVHTLNGSGVALARLVAALLETGLTPLGRVKIPEILRPYMGGQEFIGKED